MHKKSLIFLGVLAVILIIYFLWSFPFMTRVDLTLNAVRMDHEGNVTGEAVIHVEGNRYDYLFQMSRLDVNIGAFDGHYDIYAATFTSDYGDVVGAIRSYESDEYEFVTYAGMFEPKNDMFIGTLAFSPDLDKWIFCNKTYGVYYVASVSGEYTAAELADYFHWLMSPPAQ